MKLYTEEQLLQAAEFGYQVKSNEEILNLLTPIELPTAQDMAVLFHNNYEELAPKFGYQTKIETRVFNKDSVNGKLMIEVCSQILKKLIELIQGGNK